MSELEPEEYSAFLGDFENLPPVEDTSGTDLLGEFEEFEAPPPVEEPAGTGFEDATVTIGDGSCVVCGAPTFRPPGLTKTGRKKRTPKYCDLHAPHARISSDGPDAPRLESQLARIQEELADDLRLLGTLTGPLLPVTGYYVIDNADRFTIALLKLSKNNTRILRVLHRAASVAPVYTLAECVAGTAYAVQVDQNKVDPHNTVARRLGVSRAYDSVYNNEPLETPSSFNTNGFGAPPRYAQAG